MGRNRIASALAGRPIRPRVSDRRRGPSFAAAVLPHVASGDFVGDHWLASFAVYLLTAK